MAEPILIWGAGAIGGCIGAHWARAGMDVLLVDTVAEHVAACRAGTGLRIEGPVDTFSVAVPALTPEQVEGRFSTIVLAVKAHHTAEAVAMLSPHLADGGHVLSAQNGLNELTIAKEIGEDATMGAFVNFGADWLGPGQILYGNRGTVVVGELDGRARDRTHDMLKALRIFEPSATMTDNIWGVLWGKLAYGAMLFATALNDDSIARNFATPARFSVWRTLGAEVLTAAAQRGITPVGFDGFDPACFAATASESAVHTSVDALADFNRGSAKTHSGIWRDLAVRKRRTEVDAQIAIIADLAAEAGVETPAIRKLVTLIHEVESEIRQRSEETFNELAAVCI
jgi:2-dehydropantoate 2-reductase